MPRFLLIDDHAVLRRGLRQLLSEEFKSAQYDEAENAAAAMSLITTKSWDLVFLDISLPGRSGLEILPDLRQIAPRVPLLILSMNPEDQFALRALKAGAAGYINKDAAPEELLQAVHKILKGGHYVSPKLAEIFVQHLEENQPLLEHENLSHREFAVMLRLAKGDRIKAIGSDLNLSVKTVSTYRTRILAKMGLTSNASLTQYALKHNLLD